MKTTTAPGKTIYRDCDCGENAHDHDCARATGSEPIASVDSAGFSHFFACRNCRSRIYRVRVTA